MKTGIDFLADVVESKRARVQDDKRKINLVSCRTAAYDARSRAPRHALRNSLNAEGINVIAEIKRASPSKGDLNMGGSAEQVALAYSRGGAVALSVLTEEDYFRGSLDDLRAVRRSIPVSLPLLRKDFIFEEYQVHESAAAGADALLLIVALLNQETLAHLLDITENDLEMDALVEVHTREEMHRASEVGANLIAVNNRNLHTFDVSIDVSLKLAGDAPASALLVSESGLRTGADLKRLTAAGYRGFLIGEALVGSEDPENALRTIIGEAEE